jgi:hypothetical protein
MPLCLEGAAPSLLGGLAAAFRYRTPESSNGTAELVTFGNQKLEYVRHRLIVSHRQRS